MSTPEPGANYVAQKGGFCPSCKSENIEGDDVVVDDGIAHQEMGCNDCNAMWEDTYQLTGYVRLRNQ